MAFMINERDAPAKEMSWGRGRLIKLVNPDTGSRQLDFHINVLKPSGGQGPYHYHYHSNSETVYFILEGRASLLIEGKIVEAGPGTCVWIPPGEKHGVLNIGDGELKLAEVKVPAEGDFNLVSHPSHAGFTAGCGVPRP